MSVLPAGLALALRLFVALVGLCFLGVAAAAVQDVRWELRQPRALRSQVELLLDATLFVIGVSICLASWLVALI